MRSGRFRKALSSVPNTNPSCTEIVNQLAAVSPKCHSLRRAGISAKARHRADGRTGCFGLDFRAVGIDVRERILHAPEAAYDRSRNANYWFAFMFVPRLKRAFKI